jgi:hypothetical protein
MDKTWTRFRQAMPAFTDVITASSSAMKSNMFLKMAANINRKTIEAQSRELDDAVQYRERYENLLQDITHFEKKTKNESESSEEDVVHSDKANSAPKSKLQAVEVLKKTNSQLKQEIRGAKNEIGKLQA